MAIIFAHRPCNKSGFSLFCDCDPCKARRLLDIAREICMIM